MPPKKRSSKSARLGPRKGSSRSRSPGGKKKRSKSASSKLSTGITPQTQREPDMLDAPAMDNLYYIAHGPVDALEIRGFGWDGAPKGKKGKKGKKKKK